MPAGKQDGPFASASCSNSDLMVFHERLLQGDPLASNELATRLLPALRGRLRASFRSADKDVTHDAAVDALIEYFGYPKRFDSSRGVTLDRFLLVVARRRVLNRLRDAASRKRRESEYIASVVLAVRRHQHIGADHQGFLDEVVALAITNRERAAIRCWLSEESQAAIAAALGFARHPDPVQRLEVKRLKDRIRARLRRSNAALCEPRPSR